jgi:hypothetical protein
LETVLTYLPAVACGAMMLLICIPMMRNRHKGHDGSADTDQQKEIAELREEIERLKADSSIEGATKETV